MPRPVRSDAAGSARCAIGVAALPLGTPAEPAASVGVAALLTGAYKPASGERVAAIISGANMTAAQLDG